MRPVQECGSILSNAEKLVVIFRQTDDGATETQMRYLEVLCGTNSKGKDVSHPLVEARVCTFHKNTIRPSFTHINCVYIALLFNAVGEGGNFSLPPLCIDRIKQHDNVNSHRCGRSRTGRCTGGSTGCAPSRGSQ